MALIAALAGTAVAEVATTARLDKKEKKQTKRIAKKQAKKQINKLAPGLSVAHADTADSADNATNAQNAQTAETANTVADGAITASKLGGIVTRSSPNITLNDNSNASGQVSCEAGERMLGGGFNFAVFSADLNVLSSRPAVPDNPGSADAPNGAPLEQWRVSARNPAGGTGNTTFKVWAVCVTEDALAGNSARANGDGGGPAAP